jgi:N6-L-threonylcarbamoyladenine synthase
MILGIETSCDESSAALLEVKRGRVAALEHVVASQAIHSKYGGVVPEVAAREHSSMLPPILATLADRACGSPDGRKLARKVDAIAVTRGPGLITSLKVGLDTALALSVAWDKPLYGINHIEGHIYANWLPGGEFESRWNRSAGIFPALVLVVSGGHTELLLMRGHGRYLLLGATRDDAAGEAFDKTAKLMGLGYPGGPALSKLAQSGNPSAFDFPRPMMNDAHYEFSFAGLKTAVLYFLRDNRERMADEKFMADVAASVEQSIVDVLTAKCARAAARYRVKTVMLAGGVAANSKLRDDLAASLKATAPKARPVLPPKEYCTDNAAMIAAAGWFAAVGGTPPSFMKHKWRGSARRRRPDDAKKIAADPGWELGRKKL